MVVFHCAFGGAGLYFGIGNSVAGWNSICGPNSREGRIVSPIAQGGVEMDAIFVGIDASKDQLDVHVRPNGERFAVGATAKAWRS